MIPILHKVGLTLLMSDLVLLQAKVAAKTDASGAPAPAAGAEATEDPMNTQSVENPQ